MDYYNNNIAVRVIIILKVSTQMKLHTFLSAAIVQCLTILMNFYFFFYVLCTITMHSSY